MYRGKGPVSSISRAAGFPTAPDRRKNLSYRAYRPSVLNSGVSIPHTRTGVFPEPNPGTAAAAR